MTELKALLETVIQLADRMPDPHADLLTVKGINPAGNGHSSNRDGMPFHLDTAIDWWNTAKDDPRGIRSRTGVDSWASAWARSWCEIADDGSQPPSTQALLWLHGRLGWAQANYPFLTEFTTELSHVQHQLEHACGLDPIPTGRTCPSCNTQPTTQPPDTQDTPQQAPSARGGVLVRLVTDQGVADNLTCLECGGEFTPQGLASLNRIRLDALAEGQDRWIPRDQARQILGIESVFLRKWISRGNLKEDNGKVNLRHAAQLAIRARG